MWSDEESGEEDRDGMTSDEEELTEEMVERAIVRLGGHLLNDPPTGHMNLTRVSHQEVSLRTIAPGAAIDLSGPPIIQPMIAGQGLRVEVDPQGRITLISDGAPPPYAGVYQTNQPP